VLALLLAVVFLTVLGSSVGYLVGRQVNTHRQASQTGEVPTGDHPVNQPESTPAGKSCPPVSERDAKKAGSPGGLVQLLHITTRQSEAWICRDTAGELWYQGHRLGGPLDSDQYGILLRGVTQEGAGPYVAVNTDPNGVTRYLVDSSKLVIEREGQKQAEEGAVSSEQG
jgi:hypothetical protein